MPLKSQKYIDLPGGEMIGIHILEPLSAAGTENITIPEIAERTTAITASCSQLAKDGQTVLDTSPRMTADAYTMLITWTAAEIAATVNQEVIVVTNHRIRRGNYLEEEAPGYL